MDDSLKQLVDWFRSDRPLSFSRELRDEIADFLEGKRPAHRRARSPVMLVRDRMQHEIRRATLKETQREIAAELRKQGVRAPMLAAIGKLSPAGKTPEWKLKRWLEAWRPPK